METLVPIDKLFIFLRYTPGKTITFSPHDLAKRYTAKYRTPKLKYPSPYLNHLNKKLDSHLGVQLQTEMKIGRIIKRRRTSGVLIALKSYCLSIKFCSFLIQINLRILLSFIEVIQRLFHSNT